MTSQRSILAEYKERDLKYMATPPINPHKEVGYDDAQHRYFNEDVTYTSVTQLIDKFKNKFDTPERAQYMADRYGMTAEYWTTKWDKHRIKSLVRGNKIHDENEMVSYGRGYEKVETQVMPVQNRNLLPSNLPYDQLPNGIYPELILWSHKYKVAGRADKIILHNGPFKVTREYEPGKFYEYWTNEQRAADVHDYKTNETLHFESFYNYRDKTHVMMLGPLSHLMDCSMVHYTLQFSLYQFLLEEFGFLPGQRTLIHYPHEIEGLGTPDPKPYKLPYLRNEVITMLNHNLTNNA